MLEIVRSRAWFRSAELAGLVAAPLLVVLPACDHASAPPPHVAVAAAHGIHVRINSQLAMRSRADAWLTHAIFHSVGDQVEATVESTGTSSARVVVTDWSGLSGATVTLDLTHARESELRVRAMGSFASDMNPQGMVIDELDGFVLCSSADLRARPLVVAFDLNGTLDGRTCCWHGLGVVER